MQLLQLNIAHTIQWCQWLVMCLMITSWPGAQALPLTDLLNDLAQAIRTPLWGVCYSPYRQGQEANIKQDIDIIMKYTHRIRIYGTDQGVLAQVLAAVADYPEAEIYAGIWFNQEEQTYRDQFDELLTLAREQPQDFKRAIRLVSVGNEAILSGAASEETVIARIKEVRQALRALNQTVPVTTSEPMDRYTDALADAVDVLLPSLHPYFDGVSVSKAAEKVIQLAKIVMKHDRTHKKQLIIAEVGWPSSGEPNGQAVASLANAQRFAREFPIVARKYNVGYFFFEAFDQLWKHPGPHHVEQHWGIFSALRQLKLSLL
jgi:exo-beta-1,3-glucanase (GH17 family)